MEDLDILLHVNETGSEITIQMRDPKGQRITLDEMVLELEMYVMELQRAKEQLEARTYPLL